jgi:hypothetical protein
MAAGGSYRRMVERQATQADESWGIRG